MSRTLKSPAPMPKGPAEPAPAKPKESMRDLAEQIVVAIVLAMLIRGFDAEAFVIPTGSMAPTLMGRHKQVTCPQCGHEYSINASDETEASVRTNRLREVGVCVNCRYTTPVGDTPSFKGDRILVMKFPYELPFLPGSSGPKRWDVVVFHYPEKPEVNYIKRLVGLPGEDLRLLRGDIQTRPAGTTEPFRIERKPLYHQRAMQMLVYDDAHRAEKLRDRPEWERWAGQGWHAETDKGATIGRYATSGAPDDSWSELRYRHLVPDPEQWAAIEAGEKLPRDPRPTLITDFYSYNTNATYTPFENWYQPNWVGDLTLACRVDVAKPSGGLRFELVEGGVSNRCEVDLATGKATLFHGDQKLGEADTPLVGVGSHDVEFANVDDRLTLWVDGGTPFGEGLAYDEDPAAPIAPDAKDLAPAGVATRGAAVAVSGLVLKRDIYYTQNPRNPADYPIDTTSTLYTESSRIIKMFDFLADPAKFAGLKDLAPIDPYTIRPDHYMMMGDNSPRSSDSRAWSDDDAAWRSDERSSWEVPRSMLIGKAFFVYWPHGKPFGPDIRLSRDFRIPFRPYVERMKLIH